MSTPERPAPLVSIVTPVYNGAEHLRECIESVLAQTLTDWDYTIVDNASTDDTFAIASSYAQRDPRIRVLRNPATVRVVENHNIAVRAIAPGSRYCKVVQADDALFPECLAKLVAVAEAHPSVGLVGSYGLVGDEVRNTGLPWQREVFDGREVCRLRLLGGPYVFGSPTSVLYRADLVRAREAFYREGTIHADAEACFEVLQHHDLGFVHQVLHMIRMRPGSMTALSMRFNTYLPEMLHDLQVFGPGCLADEERTRRIREVVAQYDRYLGREWLKHRERGFWTYHESQRRELGHPIRRTRLAWAALRHALYLASRPVPLVRALARLARRRAAA